MCSWAYRGGKESSRASHKGPASKGEAGKECELWSSCAEEKWVVELEASLAKALEKLATAEGRVKKLDVDDQENKLQRASREREFRALKGESAGSWSQLQTALSGVSEVKSHPGHRVVVDSSVESKKIATLKAQVAALWSQLIAVQGEVEDRALVVDRTARIGGWVTAVRGELLTSLDCLGKCAIRGHREAYDSSREGTGQL